MIKKNHFSTEIQAPEPRYRYSDHLLMEFRGGLNINFLGISLSDLLVGIEQSNRHATPVNLYFWFSCEKVLSFDWPTRLARRFRRTAQSQGLLNGSPGSSSRGPFPAVSARSQHQLLLLL